MDGYCEISFNGTGGGTYYIPCDRVGDLNEEGININGTSFYAYSSIYGSDYDKRIQFPSLAKPRYYTSSSYNYTVINNMSNIVFNDKALMYRRYGQYDFYPVLLILLGINILVNLFFRRAK